MSRITLPDLGNYTAPETSTEISLPELGFFAGGFINDETAPSVPTNVSGDSATPTSVTLTWTCSTDNVEVTSYNIYRDNSLIDSASECTYTDTTVSPNTSYDYTVSALDAAGNESAQTTAVTVWADVGASYNGGLFRPGATSNAASSPSGGGGLTRS